VTADMPEQTVPSAVSMRASVAVEAAYVATTVAGLRGTFATGRTKDVAWHIGSCGLSNGCCTSANTQSPPHWLRTSAGPVPHAAEAHALAARVLTAEAPALL